MKGNFSGASLPGFLTSSAKSHREDARNGAYGLPFMSGTILSFADVVAWVTAHFMTPSVGPAEV